MSTSHEQLRGSGLALSPRQAAALAAAGSTWRTAATTGLLEIDGSLDVPRLARALARLEKSQSALRLRLAEVSGYRGLRQFFVDATQVQPVLATATDTDEGLAAWLEQAFDPREALYRIAVWTQATGSRLALSVATCASDEVGLALLLQQLHVLYTTDAPTGEDEFSFDQYLEWRAEVVQDEDAVQAGQWWHAQLQAASQVSGLTFAEGQGEAEQQRLLGLDAAPLLALAQHLGQAPERVLQAAWYWLLARLEGQQALNLDWQHDGRTDYEYFSGCAGVFVQRLPLTLKLIEDERFSQWVARLAMQLDEQITWQEYCPADRSPGWLAFSVAPATPVLGRGWQASLLAESGRSEGVSLNLSLDVHSARLDLNLNYPAGVRAEVDMAVLLEQFQTLLAHVVAEPDNVLAQVHLNSEARAQWLLAEGRGAELSSAPLLLPQAMQQHAAERPQALALTDGPRRTSYTSLLEQAQRVAGSLQVAGVAPGDRVALALPRSDRWVVAMLGTWLAGAAYVALDPQWPRQRQWQVVEQAQVACILGDASALESLPASAPPALALDWALAHTDAWQVQTNHASDTAYVLYTSGSTGQPKGVSISHGNLANYVAAASEALELASCTQFAFGSTVAADLGHTSLFGALLQGATLHVADDATMQDGDAFAGFIKANAIDCLKIVPSHLAALLETASAHLPATLVLGGEAPSTELLQCIAQVSPATRVFNHYGPTESTVGVMIHALDASECHAPLTRVLAGNWVYVLDEQHRLAPVGVTGGLYIGGAQLCTGYLNQPELSAKAFIEDPFNAGERLYCTGDLACYRASGGVQLLGRSDQQIKVRGIRVEPGEIEQRLRASEGVRDALVMQHEGELVAFVTHVDSAPSGIVAAVLANVRDSLPAAMVPVRLVALAQWPRLGNGKIDRVALTVLLHQVDQKPSLEPSSALERWLLGSMRQLLGSTGLSMEQDFFSAGGHSLLVIKLVAGVRKLLQCQVPPAIVFDHPTPVALAEALLAHETAPGTFERLAEARLRLDAMGPEERAALMARARALKQSDPA
ncbi:non-ribosomal peptide synthetase [Pseudomonas paralcaligenes]|uniref:non-ribosomal peptide synthetase n=1 Tax=Pseudomonas paralcaligenes TaxID=2772558 RepID=UPI001C7E6ACD|nr:non-ribosomal peptide synthetase [Pseudomonas paralcaligenes]